MPNAAIGRRPMMLVDADGLAGLVVDEVDLRQAEQDGLSVAHLELGLDRGADHLLRRDAVDLLGPGAHELDAATGDDEGLEAVGAQIGQQLQHRLVDELGVGPVEADGRARSRSSREAIFANSSVVMPACVAAISSIRPFSPEAASACMSPSSTALKGCVVVQFGLLWRQRLHTVEDEGELDIHRLLDPQRAVVVERGDALVGRHEVGPALRGDARDEVSDGFLRRAVVPGRQRVGLRRGMRAQTASPSQVKRSATCVVQSTHDQPSVRAR